MKNWARASLILALALHPAGAPRSSEKAASGAATIAIDIFPGEERNIVDREAPERVRVAVLQGASFDVQGIDPESLRLAGAGIVKDASGNTHVLEDVDGDGDLDLVVLFAARQVQLADGDTLATLEGRTKSGDPVRGTDRVETLAAALDAETAAKSDDEKLEALDVTVRLLPTQPTGGRIPVAILGDGALDPRTLSLRSLRLGAAGITKGDKGDLVVYRDVDGDGREDAVVWFLEAATTLSAQTQSGRMVRGTLEGTSPSSAPLAEESAPEEGGEKGRYPLAIQILDNGAASPYPASITMSGVSGVVSKVRVTLNGLQHDCPNDLDVLLVGPNGQAVVVMSDVGGCQPFPSPSQLTLDDFATATLSPAQTPSVLASYRPANNGVGDPFPAPASGQLAASALSAFNGINPNGVWKLYVVDDTPGGVGSIAQGWTLDLVTTTRFCNTVHVSIPDFGPSNPYPHNINVSGLPRAISKATVTLQGLTHTFTDDLDVLLVGPGGQRVMLMSDAGGGNPGVSNLQLTFDDDANGYVPDATNIPGSGSYRPTNQEPGESLPAPAPGWPYGALMADLKGSSPNGTWQLWVSDDAAGDSGEILQGWCIDLTTVVPADNCQPLAVTIPAGAPGVTSGPATPYPSTMHLEGTTGLVDYAEVRLLGLSHTFPDDLDIFLQSPFGKTVSLMSDGGGSTPVSNLDLRFTDLPIPPVPDSGPLGAGPYGVSNYEGGEFMPNGGPFASYTSFAGEVPNGDWRLWVADDAGGDVGSIAGGWCMNLVLREPYEAYCSTDFGPLTIPAGAPGTTAGPADPYPWAQNILERGSSIRKLQVSLFFNHTFPDDLDVLLVSPLGQTVMLLSDSGGSTDFAGFITFDDEAGAPAPDNDPLVDGTIYRTANYAGGDGDAFPPGAPPGPYGTDLSAFRGTSPLGSWFLYVLDDAGSDIGSASKWCINVFRAYPSAEAKSLRWKPSPAKSTAEWDPAANATEYRVLRGTPADLPSLVSGAQDGCTAVTETQTATSTLTTVPAPGSFFWYLVLGASGNTAGPAGQARIGGIDAARSVESTGVCASP